MASEPNPNLSDVHESAPQRLGELLCARGKLDAVGLDRALKVQESARQAGGRDKLGAILTRM
ncbi:MAG: hypothetical protein ACOVN2_00245, partial [Usitatibacteraceae bacterium]